MPGSSCPPPPNAAWKSRSAGVWSGCVVGHQAGGMRAFSVITPLNQGPLKQAKAPFPKLFLGPGTPNGGISDAQSKTLTTPAVSTQQLFCPTRKVINHHWYVKMPEPRNNIVATRQPRHSQVILDMVVRLKSTSNAILKTQAREEKNE